MRSPLRLVIAAILVAGLGLFALWRHRVADQAEEAVRVEREATAAMAALNQANDELVAWFPAAMKDLAGPLMTDPAGAARQMSADILPRVEAFLAIADRAVVTADAYQVRLRDPEVQPMIETVRRRTTAMHGVHRTLVSIRDQLARGNLSPEDLGRVTGALQAAATKMLMAN